MHFLIQRHLYICSLLLCFLFLGTRQAYAQGTVSCTVSIESAQASNICQGESITLTARPGNNFTPDTHQWFLDGSAITGATSSTYTSNVPGTYTVEVTGPSCTGTITSGQFSVVQDPTPGRPTLSVTPTGAICSGTQLTFNVPNGDPDVIYVWDFGNGNSASTTGTDPITQMYDSTGIGTASFTVQVFGVSRKGCASDTVSQTINVKQKPIVAFTEANDFQICLPDTVAPADTAIFATITNTTQEPYLGDIARYIVDWGNGETKSYLNSDFPIKNPTAYDTLGNYPIKIQAVNKNGCAAEFTQVYKLSQEPKANFTIDKKERLEEAQMPPCVPVVVTPADSSTGGNLSYTWSVQPDQGYTLQSGSLDAADPVFIFNESGVYNIELVVENGCGTDTTSQSIVVGWPQVQIPSSVTECGPTTIDYSSSGAGGGGGAPGGGGLMIDKNLGENVTVTITITGPTSTTRTFNSDTFQFAYDFTRPGTYTVAVEAVNECGSSNAIYQGQPAPTQEVVILQQPAAPTIQAPGAVCAGESVTLTPSGPGPIYAWFESEAPAAIPVAVGPSFTTPSLSDDITYYVAAIDTANNIQCIGPKTPVAIDVVPGITNNTIEGEPARNVCKGETPAELTGSTPEGGDTSVPYSYTWQLSTTGPSAGFTDAPGVNNTINYTPTAAVTTNTWFRRLVLSGNCNTDSSNVVAIIAVDPVPASANTISPAQEICEGDTPAPLIGSRPTGGAGGPYTYLWEISTEGPAAGFVAAPGANNTENYTFPAGALNQPETWVRRAVTSGGCTAYSEPIKITVFPAIANNTIGNDQEVCTGTAPVALTGSAPTGGNGTYTYLWESSTAGPDRGFAAAAGTNTGQSYTPGNIAQTTFYRRVVTAGDCTPNTSEVVTIEVNEGIQNNSITADQPAVCASQTTVTFRGSTPTGGTGTYTYLWESSTSGPTAGFNPAAGTNDGINYTSPTLTQNTWFRRVVSSEGCSRASEAIEITVNPLPENPVLATRDARACPDGSATLEVTNANGNTIEWYTAPTGGAPIFVGPIFTTPSLQQTTTYYAQAVNANTCMSAARTEVTVTIVEPVADAGEDVTIIQGRTAELRATGGVTYLWEPAEGLNNPTLARPIASPQETTTYTVTVTTAEGCTATDEVTVTVIPAITVPNAFTPNRDQVNETWEIENHENYPEMRVEVFNRWGNRIFSSSAGYNVPWDGTYNGEVLPVATYYYIIYLNSTEKPISGNVTIIR
ncbi:gliding motility-associated C-terminal domain-containing protein [Pontibacter sp. E15-1]|uniref:gliding motility-associated C-terminal domain-containing protein n=1 Tax=Pontibacter sp. E15-1 TaxID=2919918 RepID=UPI001F4F97F7|nr:gliding motility-associated C-terminal domain-containing protein [Pontibacter sp. E15-1]MCJ8163928.1 gliding motility-associated C-terminal domain-containing protein [Pontibacter sp. E15-1]